METKSGIFRQPIAFGKSFLHHLRSCHIFQRAAALSYTTLLAIVPLLAVALAILTAFTAFRELSESWQGVLFEHLVPAARQEIESHLRLFTEKAKQLTGPGIVFLVVTATLLMKSVEEALNALWQTEPPASLRQRLLGYWAVLTLGPLLVGSGVLLTRRVAPALFPVQILPFLFEWLAFLLLFQLVPNAPVRWRFAALGGAFSAALFELAKFGFAIYLHYSAYQVIYGALAAVPIFLVWLYLTWLVTLSGAVLTYTLHFYRQADRLSSEDPCRLDLVFRLLQEVWTLQERGEPCPTERLLEALPLPGLMALLDRLREAGWLGRDEEGSWFLKRDPHTTTLWELYRALPLYLPPEGDPKLPPLLQQAASLLREPFQVTLAELFAYNGKNRLPSGGHPCGDSFS